MPKKNLDLATYQPFLDLYKKTGERPYELKLNSVRRAYEILGSPLGNTNVVLVGGTNGKGSTSSLTAMILACLGQKIGLFTSPHICHPRERFTIYEGLAPKARNDASIIEVFESVSDRLPSALWDSLSFFEVCTLVAAEYFQREGVDTAVIEVGLGGRLDSTNIIPHQTSIIVSIGLDHRDLLGPTLTDIAKEKAGILPGSTLCLFGRDTDHSADNRWQPIREAAALGGTQLLQQGNHFGRDTDRTYFFTQSQKRVKHRNLKMLNSPSHHFNYTQYIADNLAFALQYAASLKFTPTEIGTALQKLLLAEPAPGLIGRFQHTTLPQALGGGNVLFDVCHNPAAVDCFLNTLQQSPFESEIALVCFLKDKEINEMLDQIRSCFKTVILFRIEYYRCFQEDQIHTRHADLPIMENFTIACRSLARDNSTAKNLVGGSTPDKPKNTLVVCGSAMAVGIAMRECLGI